jgi:hypothetical protein
VATVYLYERSRTASKLKPTCERAERQRGGRGMRLCEANVNSTSHVHVGDLSEMGLVRKQYPNFLDTYFYEFGTQILSGRST